MLHTTGRMPLLIISVSHPRTSSRPLSLALSLALHARTVTCTARSQASELLNSRPHSSIRNLALAGEPAGKLCIWWTVHLVDYALSGWSSSRSLSQFCVIPSLFVPSLLYHSPLRAFPRPGDAEEFGGGMGCMNDEFDRKGW